MASATHIAARNAELEDWPIPAEQIVAGQPRARGTVLHEGPEGTGCGVWECTPGTFDWAYDTRYDLPAGAIGGYTSGFGARVQFQF